MTTELLLGSGKRVALDGNYTLEFASASDSIKGNFLICMYSLPMLENRLECCHLSCVPMVHELEQRCHAGSSNTVDAAKRLMKQSFGGCISVSQ